MPKKETEYKGYIEKMNASPIFASLTKSLGYEKVGLQILKDEEVIQEFTSHSKDGKITKVEEGLKDPEVTVKIEEETVKQLESPKEQAWIEKHPVEAMLKYSGKIQLPFVVKLKLLSLLNKTGAE